MKKWAPLLGLALIGFAAWILSVRLRAVDFDDVVAHLEALPHATLLAGAACAAGVYILVGVYEAIALRLATGRRAFVLPFRTALIANPIGRAVGLALVSGGALRYRMYTAAGLTAREIAAVIVLAAMPYLIGVGWLIDLSLLFHVEEASRALRLSSEAVLTLAILGLLKDVGWLVFVAVRKTPLKIGEQTVRLPSLPQTLLQAAFGLMQISLMTAILYVFMPPELNLSWLAFVAVYCLAFIAGQLSNVPAGLGVLEAALLLLLPQVPAASLLGAVVAYRAVYELAPLMLGVALLIGYEMLHPAGLVRRRAS